jgi:hypothetical protein
MAKDFPTRSFSNDAEFAEAIAAMDRVTETVVLNGGKPSEHYKGLKYVRGGHEASIVSKRYGVSQHPDFLTNVHSSIKPFKAEPKGTIAESSRGLLTATVHFFNPSFNCARLLGELAADEACHLGITVTSDHMGEHSVKILAQAKRSNGTTYILSDFLGSESFRHVGKVAERTSKVVAGMLDRLPMLGAAVQSAKATVLTPEDMEACLWGLGLGEKSRQVILRGKPTTAWELFDKVCQNAKRIDLGDRGRVDELTEAQRILNPNKLDALIEAGQTARLKAEAKAEPAPGQLTLKLEVEA